jgi:CRISPR-associated protein Cas6
VNSTGVIVDLSFPLRGTVIPADHGSLLYAAISRQIASFHSEGKIGIHPIRGRLVGQRRLSLTRASRLVLRLPSGRIAEAIPLVGQRLEVGEFGLDVGVPTVLPLRPAASLVGRLVTIRGFTEPVLFLEAARRQLRTLSVEAVASLLPRTAPQSVEGRTRGSEGTYIRRTLRLHDKEIVGFALRVDGLSPSESIQLQEVGIGGRRRFGCGLFVPARR